MKKIKEFFNNLFINPITKMFTIILGVFLLLVIFIIILASCSAKKTITYQSLEKKMVDLARNRYENKDLPKKDKDILEVSLQSFVDEGKIKDIESIVQNHSVCTGNIKIINNNGNYLYIPYLNCGNDYKTTTIYDILTKEENIVNNGNGLYKINNEYIYKGDNINNYLLLNDILYRIIKINEDGTIKLLESTKKDYTVWDDRYNIEKEYNYGINNYIYNGLNSRIKDTIENDYNDKELYPNEIKAYFINKPICTGKRSINDNIFTNVECNESIIEYPFSLLTVYDFFNATLDKNCNNIENESCLNYNYLADIGSTWTITADKDSTYKAYRISESGVNLSNTSTNIPYRIVTNINKELVFESGNGSINNPYIIKAY